MSGESFISGDYGEKATYRYSVEIVNAAFCPSFWAPIKWRRNFKKIFREVISMTERIWTNPYWWLSFLTWIIGKIFDLNGCYVTCIIFEAVSKMSGKRQ